MTIVCGTDLTPSAVRAGHAAAAIARRLGVPLRLVHVLDDLGAELTIAQEGDTAFADVRARLRAEAQALQQRFEIEVEPIAIPGRADTEIIALAARSRAELVVVAAVGRTQRHRWLLGSIAEQVARRSPTSVLVVRDSRSLVAWASGERALEILVGVDPSSTSKAALAWSIGLRRIGPCDIKIVQLVSPVEEHARLGIGIPASSREPLHRELEQILRRDLRASVGSISGPGDTSVEVHARTEPVDWQLSQMAESADLLVVGTHQRAGIERVWHGSVSRGVLRHASTNIACVPRGDSLARTDYPPIHRVLVPTDFSPLANRAIPVAYALVPPDGVVHLIHVVRHDGVDVRAVEQALRKLIPPTKVGVVATEVEVIEATDAATAIGQAAGRLGVDLVCMATRGRSGLSGLVLGSHAQRVVASVRQPVVLVPPEQPE